jgi:hypothetical protein
MSGFKCAASRSRHGACTPLGAGSPRGVDPTTSRAAISHASPTIPESESALLLTTASQHHTMPYLGGFST